MLAVNAENTHLEMSEKWLSAIKGEVEYVVYMRRRKNSDTVRENGLSFFRQRKKGAAASSRERTLQF